MSEHILCFILVNSEHFAIFSRSNAIESKLNCNSKLTISNRIVPTYDIDWKIIQEFYAIEN